MSSIEGRIGGTPDESVDDKPRAKWWSTALTRGHLETKLNSTKLLEIPLQYKRMLILYAKKIADEGFRAKGEGLIKELLGLYIGMPLVLFRRCIPKRDQLKDVLSIFARSKTLTKLALDWQDTVVPSTERYAIAPFLRVLQDRLRTGLQQVG
ncbi:hypothetical protein K443DRAFT_5757 [Laccaria amethystina LaAM-08-1]|uniref:Protein HIRA-like C-terminal domain-containing protein n=1 Tax=Laccaria amethystina LaAM-08-1 TaxID=1095629 RepID=A0A0C9WUH5_9AGAR|nr:hypothetical protein K443DRAFT_5757 [Laccaria amethystina LaAM-08-1]